MNFLNISRVSKDFHYFADFMVTAGLHEPVELKKPLPWSVANTEKTFYIKLYRSLYIARRTKVYNDSNPFHPLEGCRIIVHKTDEFPTSTDFHLFQLYKKYIDIKIKPEMFLIDDDLKSWSPERRRCYLKNEKSLNFYRIYTKKNCEHECLSYDILNSCQCVPFYIIREFLL